MGPAHIWVVPLRRSSRARSREVRIRVHFSVVYFSRGTLPQKSWSKGTAGDLVMSQNRLLGSATPSMPKTA